jgi:hypothetical protein
MGETSLGEGRTVKYEVAIIAPEIIIITNRTSIVRII